jgi:hypothetical protein
MIDEQGKRLEAVHGRVANIVLYGVAIVAFVFLGYANGLEERRLRLPVYLMGAIVAAVILLIQDLDRPAAGRHEDPARLIRQQRLDRLPPKLRQFVAPHRQIPLWSLNHSFGNSL